MCVLSQLFYKIRYLFLFTGRWAYNLGQAYKQDLTLCLFPCFITGTVVSGLIAFFLTRREIPLKDRASILCVNCFVGIMQLTTIVFLMIGWIWSIVWGCAFVGLSGKFTVRSGYSCTSLCCTSHNRHLSKTANFCQSKHSSTNVS